MKDSIKIKKQLRDLRKKRIKAKIQGTAQVPRLCVYRSLTSIYAQLIDDSAGKTLLSFDSREIKKGNKTEKAKNVGEQIAKLAKEKGIEKVVFDRCGFRYHGRVKALAEGAREGGLIF